MQTGRLLELLTGHEAPVSSLAFCPTRGLLVSGSWDKTARLWDVFGSKGTAETLQLTSDVMALAFRPDGSQLAVASLDAQITFWDMRSSAQEGSIESRSNLEVGRRSTDKVTAQTLSAGAHFTCLCYTADGQNILAGGRSKVVCLYNVSQQILLRKFQVSRNLSLDGMQRFLGGQGMTEAGPLGLISGDEEEEEEERGDGLKLPGVYRGDLSSRKVKPEIRVKSVQFSPTGQSWAAVTTEGLIVYTLDTGLVFDPYDLSEEVTPEGIATAISQRRFAEALAMSLRLNEHPLVLQAAEAVPTEDSESLAGCLEPLYRFEQQKD
jgi:periodic tryptophan protein 2